MATHEETDEDASNDPCDGEKDVGGDRVSVNDDMTNGTIATGVPCIIGINSVWRREADIL